MITLTAVLAAALATTSQEAPEPADVPSVGRLTHITMAYGAWSPDGRTIVFQSNAAGNYDIYTMRPSGEEVSELIASPANDITPVYSPDGKTIAFVSERDGNREVYLCDADGGNQRNITNLRGNDIHPVFSPDGSLIIFSSNRNKLNADDFDLYTMKPDGSDVRQLTSGPEVDTYASWSPDGSQIVLRRVIEGNNEVYVMNADGSDARNLTSSINYDGWPVWSPDGTRIAYASGPGGASPHRIYIMHPDGSNKRALTDRGPNRPFVYDTHPYFSPDGTTLSFTRYREGRAESSDIAVLAVPAGA